MTKRPNHVTLQWDGDHRFDAGRVDGPKIRIDADAVTGPGPVDALLIALGSCTAVDVVEILKKRRTPAESLTIDVIGERFDGIPRRLVHATLLYRISGDGIDRHHAERAIELAVRRYCSVKDSLDPEIPVDWKLELNGES